MLESPPTPAAAVFDAELFEVKVPVLGVFDVLELDSLV